MSYPYTIEHIGIKLYKINFDNEVSHKIENILRIYDIRTTIVDSVI